MESDQTIIHLKHTLANTTDLLFDSLPITETGESIFINITIINWLQYPSPQYYVVLCQQQHQQRRGTVAARVCPFNYTPSHFNYHHDNVINDATWPSLIPTPSRRNRNWRAERAAAVVVVNAACTLWHQFEKKQEEECGKCKYGKVFVNWTVRKVRLSQYYLKCGRKIILWLYSHIMVSQMLSNLFKSNEHLFVSHIIWSHII